MASDTPTKVAAVLIIIFAFAFLLWLVDSILKIGIGKAFCLAFFTEVHKYVPSQIIGDLTREAYLNLRCGGGAIPV